MKVFLCCALGLVAVFDVCQFIRPQEAKTLEMVKCVAKEMLEAEEEDATVELEILCGTVADLLDDRSDEPGVSGQQVQAQPGMVQRAQDWADRKKALLGGKVS